jgi:hypothetical protein
MTNDELRRAQTRLEDAKAARRGELVAAAPAFTAPAYGSAAPYVKGQRVQDLRGGREGTVSDVTAADATGSVLVWVRFADGSLIVRPPRDLIARPSPPASRP